MQGREIRRLSVGVTPRCYIESLLFLEMAEPITDVRSDSTSCFYWGPNKLREIFSFFYYIRMNEQLGMKYSRRKPIDRRIIVTINSL